MTESTRHADIRPAEPASLAQLREDCALLRRRWSPSPGQPDPLADRGPRGHHATPPRPGGVRVPEGCVRLLDDMPGYAE
ncbi:hypothetical protein [Streptomyces oceani]|uniref:Uncharacterized protein n=1 Tax=Streptomyces oceani TaxID=1075402 RepID=A0A1E7KCK6_9ACTN|nr:hypothetical protein [Streptomyces oceani]OEV01696.1 hypothetical protein AN216_16830 [Streptomyces oceani]